MRMALLAAVGLLAGLGLVGGCFFSLDCADDQTCPPGTSGTTSTGTGPMNCDPTAGPVGASCGVFVSSSMGNDKNDGGKFETPKYRTLPVE